MLRKIKIINLLFFLWFIGVFSLNPSIESDKKNRMVFSDNNRVKHCAKQRFKELVAIYIDELHNDLSQSCSTVSTLDKILLQVKHCTKLEQVIALLNRVDSPFIREHKQVQSALLLQVSVVLGDYTYKMLLGLLTIVDSHLSYWQEMNDHSDYYFFHKSPFKWIIGKNQQQEINDNIQLLYAIQKKYLKTLGLLTKHLQQFNDNGTIDEHYTWLGQFIMIIQALCTRRHKVDVIDCENATIAMRRVLKNILPYKNRVLLVIDKAKPPYHFVRNWTRYVALLIGAGFAYKNRVLIDTWAGKNSQNQYKKFVNSAWRKCFISPMKNAYDTIMINDGTKKTNIIGEMQEKKKLIVQSKKLLAEQDSQLKKYIEDTKNRRAITCESIKKDLEQKLEANLIKIEEKEKILHDIHEGDIGSLQQFFNNLPKTIKFFFGGIEVAAVQSGLNLIQFIWFSDGQKVVNDTRSILNHVSKALVNVDEALLYFVDLLDSEIKKTQMTLRFIALIPAMVTGWGMYKLTNKFYVLLTRHNYSVMRNIVVQINEMLIEFHDDMNNECYGKLIYLLYKLKRAALVQIPQKSIKRKFLRDIEIFSWYGYTAGEKRLLIDNMRWKYDFLSPSYNT